MKKSNKSYGYLASDVQSAVAESYKTIRTNLQFLFTRKEGCKVITISSPQASDGKTTNSVNLAISFSQLGKKVLLIDADLRRPSVYRKLKIENNDGLSGVLAGFCSPEKTIVSINPHFSVLTSGAVPPNPSELLASKDFESLIEKLKASYDYIIIDTAPIGIVSDALSVARNSDGVLLVIKEKVTTYQAFEGVVDSLKLADIPLLGVVLNGITSNNRYHYYKNRY
ncbi:MAG: CpsD/CapB family tyrosine-protein kinase [Clostridia bacterium]|nr:CpsD/CapB family tyrosine-protein kinase [Clostridia bacterium]